MKLQERIRRKIYEAQCLTSSKVAALFGFRDIFDVDTIITRKNCEGAHVMLKKMETEILENYPAEMTKKFREVLPTLSDTTPARDLITIFRQVLRVHRGRLISRKKYEWDPNIKEQDYILEYKIIMDRPRQFDTELKTREDGLNGVVKGGSAKKRERPMGTEVKNDETMDTVVKKVKTTVKKDDVGVEKETTEVPETVSSDVVQDVVVSSDVVQDVVVLNEEEVEAVEVEKAVEKAVEAVVEAVDVVQDVKVSSDVVQDATVQDVKVQDATIVDTQVDTPVQSPINNTTPVQSPLNSPTQ